MPSHMQLEGWLCTELTHHIDDMVMSAGTLDKMRDCSITFTRQGTLLAQFCFNNFISTGN
jgi:hypothetical protein